MSWDSKRGTRFSRAPFEFRVVGQFESKRALSVPKNTGRRGLYKTIWAILGFALVAAARFLGGQLCVFVHKRNSTSTEFRYRATAQQECNKISHASDLTASCRPLTINVRASSAEAACFSKSLVRLARTRINTKTGSTLHLKRSA
jgi:hypothetical protein